MEKVFFSDVMRRHWVIHEYFEVNKESEVTINVNYEEHRKSFFLSLIESFIFNEYFGHVSLSDLSVAKSERFNESRRHRNKLICNNLRIDFNGFFMRSVCGRSNFQCKHFLKILIHRQSLKRKPEINHFVCSTSHCESTSCASAGKLLSFSECISLLLIRHALIKTLIYW